MENTLGVLFFVGCLAISGYLIGGLQAYLISWLFFVPVRYKLPMFFNAFLGALPWFAGFLVPIFFVEEGGRFGLEDIEGKLLAISVGAFLIGAHVFANRWARLLQDGGWIGARGARNATLWAGCVAICATVFAVYMALSAHS